MTTNIPHLIDFQKYRHIWCFGCSFTKWSWPTWADLLANKYPATNLGQSGAGNQYIFHQLIRKKRDKEILPQDLVMICWTSFFRESRQVGDAWTNPGNLWTQQVYGKEFLRFCDPRAMFLRDLDLIEATQKTLLGHCDFVEFSMAPAGLLNQYHNKKLPENNHQKQITGNWLPSFYEVLWGGDITSITKSRQDPHPTTEEHKIYLKKVFNLDYL
jgi:hypothetical protein